MSKPFLYGIGGFMLAVSLAGAGYYAGQEINSNPNLAIQANNAVSSHVTSSSPNVPDEASKIVGVWAPVDGGCGTGYGAVYSASGRFSEGDEFSGVEGRWEITDATLVRDTTSKYELDETADADAPPAVTTLRQVNRFPIVKLTADTLTFNDQGKRFSYVKCPEGRRIFLDGEQVGPS